MSGNEHTWLQGSPVGLNIICCVLGTHPPCPSSSQQQQSSGGHSIKVRLAHAWSQGSPNGFSGDCDVPGIHCPKPSSLQQQQGAVGVVDQKGTVNSEARGAKEIRLASQDQGGPASYRMSVLLVTVVLSKQST